MAGGNVQVCRKTTYQAPAISTGSCANVIAQLIETLAWKSGVLQVRLYAKTLAGSGNTATVYVYNSLVSADDPSQVFMDDTNALASASIGGNAAAGTLHNVAFSSSVPIGRYVSVVLAFGATGTAISGNVTIGVDLVGRDT